MNMDLYNECHILMIYWNLYKYIYSRISM